MDGQTDRRTDGRTDRQKNRQTGKQTYMTNLIVAFRNIANALKNSTLFSQNIYDILHESQRVFFFFGQYLFGFNKRKGLFGYNSG
jgi:hypothetical protein